MKPLYCIANMSRCATTSHVAIRQRDVGPMPAAESVPGGAPTMR
jgi:hypothetical protein